MVLNKFAEKLKKLRIERGFSQENSRSKSIWIAPITPLLNQANEMYL